MGMGEGLVIASVGGLIAFLQALILAHLKNIDKKVTELCVENRIEHNELYAAKNKMEIRVMAIETVHHIKGCDEPRK